MTDGRPGDRPVAGKRMIGGAATGGQAYAQRRLAGRALRARVPRSAQGTWEAPAGRADPVDLLEENTRSRLPDLVPVRYGRMLSSPAASTGNSPTTTSRPVTPLRLRREGASR